MADFTELAGNRRYKRIDWAGPLPPCQHHFFPGDYHECDKPGAFDSPTPYGPWADLCEAHAIIHGKRNSALGYHRITKEN